MTHYFQLRNGENILLLYFDNMINQSIPSPDVRLLFIMRALGTKKRKPNIEETRTGWMRLE